MFPPQLSPRWPRGYPGSPIVPVCGPREVGNTGLCAVTPRHRPTPVCPERRCPCVIFPTWVARAAVYFAVTVTAPPQWSGSRW